MKTSALALQLIVFSASAAAFAQIPSLTLPEGVGVNIHFAAGHTRDLDLIAAAGFKFVRMDLIWQATERAPGQYDWTPYDELGQPPQARAAFARCLFLTTPTPPTKPTSPPAAPSASRCRIRHRLPAPPREHRRLRPLVRRRRHPFSRRQCDLGNLQRAKRLLLETQNPTPANIRPSPLPPPRHPPSRAKTPPSPPPPSPPWTGISSKSFSPPASSKPSTPSPSIPTAKALVHPKPPPPTTPNSANGSITTPPPPKKAKIPILSGEWGYHTSSHGVSLETQAAYAARQQLFNLSKGVPLSIWYDWKNDGTNPNDGEQNFGTVTDALDPKPRLPRPSKP